jgi:hypothetical protein
MRILQFDEATRKEIQKAIVYANAHKMSILELEQTLNDPGKAAGFDPGFVTHIHDGFRVVYSIEEQPVGWCHHISISVESKTKYPHEIAIDEILKEFGMEQRSSGKTVQIWLEEEFQAVNILQKMKQP